MPGISPRVNPRSRMLSSRRCSEVNRMVVPFGSARERRSRTTYRPAVTPQGSTHVDTFTGTTSSVSRTAAAKVAVVAVVRQPLKDRGTDNGDYHPFCPGGSPMSPGIPRVRGRAGFRAILRAPAGRITNQTLLVALVLVFGTGVATVAI